MKKNINKDNGISLISLVVTIIVILILASVATYSGINSIKLSEFTRFTAELKIMQTEVNSLYEKWQNQETIDDKEILTYGKEISSDEKVQQQANKVFTQEESGITSQIGYKYYDKETLELLKIEGVKQEFFVNVQTRSIVSYYGIEYKDEMYYTLIQIPNSLYNVEYNSDNININPQIGNIKAENIENSYWKISVEDIQYGGYVEKGKIQYQKFNNDNWTEISENSFIVKEDGIYIIKIIDNAGNESNNSIKYVGNISIETGDNIKVIIPGLPENFKENLNIQYKKTSDENWEDILDDGSFTVTESGMYNIKFDINGIEDIITIYAGDVNFNSADSTSWNFSINQENYKIKYKEDSRLSEWQESENNVAKINNSGTYNIKVIDENGTESFNYLTQYSYVKEGLVLCYDGINNTGSGHNSSTNVWTDLSGNNNNGQINNEYIWNEKSIQLNNASGGITGKYTSSLRLTNFTIETVLESYTTNSNGALLYDFHAYEKYGYFAKIYDSLLHVAFGNRRYSYNYNFIEENYPIAITIECNKAGNEFKIYINGNNMHTYTGTIDIDTTTASLFGILNNDACDEGVYLDRVNNFKIYNRVLTDEEIKQNYEIDKIRYNIDE